MRDSELTGKEVNHREPDSISQGGFGSSQNNRAGCALPLEMSRKLEKMYETKSTFRHRTINITGSLLLGAGKETR